MWGINIVCRSLPTKCSFIRVPLKFLLFVRCSSNLDTTQMRHTFAILYAVTYVCKYVLIKSAKIRSLGYFVISLTIFTYLLECICASTDIHICVLRYVRKYSYIFYSKLPHRKNLH